MFAHTHFIRGASTGGVPRRYYRFDFLTSNSPPTIALSDIELASTPGGPDLTRPATTVTASSAIELPSNVVDNNDNTYWHSNAGMPHWLVLDLGVGFEMDLYEVRIRARNGFGYQTPSHFQVSFSDDGVTWTMLGGAYGLASWDGYQTFIVRPYFTSVPVISGVWAVGQTVTATFDSCLPSTAPVSYQWYRDDTPIPGENGPSYTLTSADLVSDTFVNCSVSASNKNGATVYRPGKFLGNPISASWRILTSSARDNAYCGFAEIEMRSTVGGANQLTGGTATAKSQLNTTQAAPFAVDGNTTTMWHSANTGLVHWWAYERPTRFRVAQVYIRARSDDSYDVGPRDFVVQFYNPVGGWISASATFNGGSWGSGEVKTFTL